MFILEGPDGSGKSVLSEKLGRLLGVPVLHHGGPPRSSEELGERLERQFDSFGHIIDRSPIVSERVYGPVIRGSMLVDESYLKKWTERFRMRGWILLYCRPTNDILQQYAAECLMQRAEEKKYKTRDHAQGVKDNIMLIAEKYDAVIERIRQGGMTVLRHNYVRP